MKISVVMTAMNDQETIMETTESILSQKRFPDQFGVALGPSLDQTDEFVDFYRDEIDFCLRVDELDVTRFGRGELRAEAIPFLDADYALFLPADVFLYRNALAQLENTVESASRDPRVVFSPLNYIDYEDEVIEWGLEELGAKNILELGPVNPASVLFRVSDFESIQNDLLTTAFGPFMTLAWVLKMLAGESAVADLIDEPIGETWTFVEGAHCWSRSVFQSLTNLGNYVDEILPQRRDQLMAWIDYVRNTQEGDEGVLSETFNQLEGDGVPDGKKSWVKVPISFPE